MGGYKGEPPYSFMLCAIPFSFTAERVRRVEAVFDEGRDDDLVHHHQRQGLAAAIVLRHQQVMRRHLDGIGELGEAVRLDGRRNLLCDLAGSHDVALGRNGHFADRSSTGAERGPTGRRSSGSSGLGMRATRTSFIVSGMLLDGFRIQAVSKSAMC